MVGHRKIEEEGDFWCLGREDNGEWQVGLEESMRRNILVLKWGRKKEGRIEEKLEEGNAEGSIVGYCVESPCCEL